VFAPTFAILSQAIADRAFPGAAVAVLADGKLVALRGMGASISPSVSKVVGTTAMAMLRLSRR
jgi:hypothetical protein